MPSPGLTMKSKIQGMNVDLEKLLIEYRVSHLKFLYLGLNRRKSCITSGIRK